MKITKPKIHFLILLGALIGLAMIDHLGLTQEVQVVSVDHFEIQPLINQQVAKNP
ncbi:MAG: hypothetical protein JXQ87_03120 [Bacteroidia bacterium]